MITITHKINDPRGVHARPAGQLVKVLSAFSCKVEGTHLPTHYVAPLVAEIR